MAAENQSVEFDLPVFSQPAATLFQTEQDVISQAVAALVAQGKTSEILTPSEALVDSFAAQGLDFQVVKTYVGDSLVSQRELGVIDLTLYPADEASMEALMSYLVQERNLPHDMTWSFQVESGVVTAVEFTLSEGYTMVLDELDGTSTPVSSQTISEEFLGNIAPIEIEIPDEVPATPAEPVIPEETEASVEFQNPEEETEPTEDVVEVIAEGCDHTARAGTVTFQWVTDVSYTDVDGDGIVNSVDNPYADLDDCVLVYDADSDSYTAAPTTSTVYFVSSVTYTCSKCGETVTGYNDLPVEENKPPVDENLVYGYYSIIDAATLGTQVLDGFIAQGFPVEYDSNDPASIATGLQTIIGILESTYGMSVQGLMAADIGYFRILVASEADAAIGQQLNYLGGCALLQPTQENYYELYMNMYATVFYAEYPTADGGVFHEEKNATEKDLEINYGAFRNYFYAKPEYFGFVADYWLSKETDATPIGAMKTMCQYDAAEMVPTYYLNYMAQMLGQALIAYSCPLGAGYGEALVAVRDYVIELINDLGTASQAQKLLVIHDYLANIANFDMNAIVQMKSDPNYATSPLGMTPYACLLTGYTETDGALCLGYAAAYTYLVQWAVMGVDGNGNLNKNRVNVDFIQVRYHSDITESSVAGDDSGFTAPDAVGASTVFNETHYMNAVYLSDNGYWYNVDACYDDINTETMSQMRVETDGNISHAFFLLAASTMSDMFEGSYDYFDSLHDGHTYFKAEAQDIGTTRVNNGWGGGWGGGNWGTTTTVNARGTSSMGYDLSTMTVTNRTDANGNTIITNNGADEGWYVGAADGYVYDADGLVVWLYKDNSSETKVNDDTYETAWFTYAASQVLWDDTYFYYVFDQDANLAEQMEMADQMDDYENDFDMDDMMDSFSENKVEGADRLVRRARYTRGTTLAPDVVADDSSSDSSNMMDFASYKANDEYTETLFHYGLASADPTNIDAAEEYAEENAGFSMGSNGDDFTSNTSDSDYDQWKNTNSFMTYVLDKDETYAEHTPDLAHSLGLDNGKLYFNFANQIFAYSISGKTRSASNLTCATSDATITGTGSTGGWGSGWGGSWGGNWGGNWGGSWGGSNNTNNASSKYSSSTYYTVDAYQSNRAFVGMSYFTDSNKGSYAWTVEDHPIAALAIYDKPVLTASGVTFEPTVVVSIGTRYAQSYLKRIAVDSNNEAVLDSDGYVTYVSPEVGLDPYEEEVPNGAYDPNYNVFGAEEGEKKKNTEFMWCANVVDSFGTARLSTLNHKHSYNSGTVTQEATCTQEGVKTYTCSSCSADTYGHTYTEVIPMTAHNLTYHAGQAGSCTTDGTLEHWTCSLCGSYFANAEGTTSITQDQITVPASGHDLIDHAAQEATCTEIGWEAYQTCSKCDYTTYVEIPALGHEAADEWEKDDTGHWKLCVRCGEKVDAAEHTPSAETPTYGNPVVCTICGFVIAEDNHQHSGTLVEAKAPTCTESGNQAYYTCSCGRYFSDEACENEVTLESVTLAPTGHAAADDWSSDATGHWNACTNGCGEKLNFAEHTSSGPATDDQDEVCTVCSFVITPKLHTHVSEYVEAKDATCGEPGNIAHYRCTECGKYFSDEACTQELTEEDVTIIVPHTLTHTPAVEAKCRNDGNTEYWTCEVCGKFFSDEAGTFEIEEESWIIEKIGHDFNYDRELTQADYYVSKYPEKQDSGHYLHCTRCSSTDGKSGLMDHVVDDCTAAEQHCVICGYTMQSPNVHPEHSYTKASDQLAQEASCENVASYYAQCEICASISDTVTIPVEGTAPGHALAYLQIPGSTTKHIEYCTREECNYSAQVKHASALGGSCTESQVCDACGYEMSAALGHQNVEVWAKKDATCTEYGVAVEHYYCPGCDAHFEDAMCSRPLTVDQWRLEKLDHVFGTTPSDTLVSAADCEHPAVYYVKCDNCDAVGETTVEVGTAAAHQWSAWTYDDQAHSRTCEVCGTSESESHYIQGTDCTKEEKCADCDYVVPAQTGHSFTDKRSDALASAADCEKAAAYYVQCDHCMAVSETDTVENPDEPALGHNEVYMFSDTVHESYCDRCNQSLLAREPHSFNVDQPTCDQAKECTVCGHVVAAAKGHTGVTLTPAKDATCIEPGNTAYYTCPTCGKHFSDITASVELERDAWIIPATGVHTYEHGLCTGCGEADPDYVEDPYDQAVALESGGTHTVTVSNLSSQLQASSISNTDSTVVSVSVRNTSSGGWGGNRTYTATVTITALAEGVSYVTINGTVYKITVSNPTFELEVGQTQTVTVSNLSSQLQASSIAVSNSDVVSISVTNTSSSGSGGWGNWGGWGGNRTYTATVTITAAAAGVSTVTINGTTYNVVVSEAST